MTSVTFCAYCGAAMLHVEAETCSSFCRSMLAVRRASMVSSAEILERAEHAVPAADARWAEPGDFHRTDIPIPREVPTYEVTHGIKFHTLPDDAQLRVINAHLVEHDRAPAVVVWTMGGAFVALGILLIWILVSS